MDTYKVNFTYAINSKKIRFGLRVQAVCKTMVPLVVLICS